MNCPRCGRTMRWERIYDDSEAVESLVCVCCGECIDRRIMENRELSLARIRERRAAQASDSCDADG